jgi:hypothetical protein
MRLVSLAMVVAAVGAGGVWVVDAVGCSNAATDCELNVCNTGSTSSGQGGAASSTTSGMGGHDGGGGTGGMGGGGGGPPMSCVPSENMGLPVAASCGVFVSTSLGSDMNAGTPEAPVATFKQALTLAAKGGMTVYACAEMFTEVVTVPAGITLYGGLQCEADAKGWKYVGPGTKTTLTAGPDTIPLTLESGNGTTTIEDLHVMAAQSANMGGSSIGAVVEGATAALTGCTIEAADGMAGAPGATYPGPAVAGSMGNSGNAACSAAAVVGGLEVDNTCGATISGGGAGGTSGVNNGGPGSPGTPGAATNGGAGDTGTGCMPGTAGNSGVIGPSAAGATGAGSINKSGFTGAPAVDGMPGTAAQGGGGGGAAKGGSGANRCAMAGSAGGASGGSGGSGGCGGAGGKGGQAGGASIALLNLNG